MSQSSWSDFPEHEPLNGLQTHRGLDSPGQQRVGQAGGWRAGTGPPPMRNTSDSSRGSYQAGAMYGERAGYEERVVYPHKRRDYAGCQRCVKYIVFACNFLFFLAGAGALAGSLYILLEKTFISDMFNNDLLTIATWLLIIASGLTMLISICGCVGAWNEGRTLLITYAVTLIVIFMAFLCGAVTALVLRGQLGEWVRMGMEETLKLHYGIDLDNKYNQEVTYAWDRGQEYMKCCSVYDQSWYIYRESRWYAEQPGAPGVNKAYVPESCCVQGDMGSNLQQCQYNTLGPPGLDQGPQNTALHYRGCYTAGVDWIWHYSAWIMGLGFGLAGLLIFGVVFSLCLALRSRK